MGKNAGVWCAVFLLIKRTRSNIFQSFLLDLVMPLYNSLRLTNETEDSRSVQHLQELAVYWACKLGHPQCLDDVVTTYHMWMEIPNNDRQLYLILLVKKFAYIVDTQ